MFGCPNRSRLFVGVEMFLRATVAIGGRRATISFHRSRRFTSSRGLCSRGARTRRPRRASSYPVAWPGLSQDAVSTGGPGRTLWFARVLQVPLEPAEAERQLRAEDRMSRSTKNDAETRQRVPLEAARAFGAGEAGGSKKRSSDGESGSIGWPVGPRGYPWEPAEARGRTRCMLVRVADGP